MCTWFNEESWGMMKTYFPDAKHTKNFPKTVLCKECTYIQKYLNESDENFVSPPDSDLTFHRHFSGSTYS